MAIGNPDMVLNTLQDPPRHSSLPFSISPKPQYQLRVAQATPSCGNEVALLHPHPHPQGSQIAQEPLSCEQADPCTQLDKKGTRTC